MRQVLDGAGAVRMSQTFDPYGNPYAQSVAPDAVPPSYGYTGEQVDANGLVYLRARYYSPSIGRFTQPDPFAGALSLPASLNPYGYTHGNPVRYADPSGEFPLLLALAIIGAGVLGTAAYGYEVHQNMQEGMDFWNAAYHQNIDWRIVGGAAAVGAVAAPTAYGCLFMWAACAAGYMWLDSVDDAATMWAAANGDPEAAVQIQMLNSMGLFNLPDLPVNFLASKWDDLAQGGKYLDDVGAFFGRQADEAAEDAGIVRRLTEMETDFADSQPLLMRRLGECSFSEDTAVETEEGSKPISEVEEGEYVLAYNEETGETDYYPVTAVWAHVDPVTVNLTIDGELIETTPEHPFYTAEGEWVPASELKIGDEIRQADDTTGTVESIEWIDEEQTMYNFTVDEAHTYFVGEGQWLVHNQCAEIYYEANLRRGVDYPLPGGTNRLRVAAAEAHNRIGNQQLFEALQSDPYFRAQMTRDFPWLMGDVQPLRGGTFPRRSPLGFIWHHADEPGKLWLIPEEQHRSIFRHLLHPSGRGGMDIWGLE